MELIKLRSLEFYDKPFRKFKNIKLNFADRITLIAGHNGIGKSTILGLIASSSGLTNKGVESLGLKSKDTKSLFDNDFSLDINRIVHLDPSELPNKEQEESEYNKLVEPWPRATYSVGQLERCKNITITNRGTKRLKVNPRDVDDSTNATKIPLPTIYLGVSRLLFIGETNEEDISSSTAILEEEDTLFIINFVDYVIEGSVNKDANTITSLAVKNTNENKKHPEYKKTKHPDYIKHGCLSASLGQDSLSSIATAVASFNKLKREMGNKYPGGLLVIDEIDSGFHPHAQQRLIDALVTSSDKLNLQILATTHSPSLVEYLHTDSVLRGNNHKNKDKVIYFADSNDPYPEDWPCDQIINNMRMGPIESAKRKVIEPIKIYLEDDEAALFLKEILHMKNSIKTIKGFKFKVIPIGVGSDSILGLPKHDSYFKTVVLLVDGDKKSSLSNSLNLPSVNGSSLNPEETLYNYISQLCDDGRNLYSETSSALRERGITSEYLNKLLNDYDKQNAKKKRNAWKSWFRRNKKDILNYKLISYWANDHKEEMELFEENLVEKLKKVSKLNV